VGRETLIEEFLEAIDDGPGSPGRATLYTGARGSGKTVLLNAVEDAARTRGWLVVSETATDGFVGRIVHQHLPRVLADFDPGAIKQRLTGVAAPMGIGSVTWRSLERQVVEAGLRSQIELLTDLLAEHETGLLITVDEVHRQQFPELRELATTIQHAFRENREVAFAGAGFQGIVADVINDKVLTFLRRAERHHLGRVTDADVARALHDPIVANGRDIGEDALKTLVGGADGYPFLIQLVGYHAWRQHPTVAEITDDDVRVGVLAATRRLGTLVHEPALGALSDIDKSFLVAMAKDDGKSKMADIQERLGVDVNYASHYRLRLIAAELIESAGHGRVDFAMPYLREYLREHVVGSL
jgi:hypothetical protein